MKTSFQQISEDVAALHKEYSELSAEKEVSVKVTINLCVDFKVGWESEDRAYVYYSDEQYCRDELYTVLGKHHDHLLDQHNDKIQELLSKVEHEAKLLNVDKTDYFDAVIENDPKAIMKIIYPEFA